VNRFYRRSRTFLGLVVLPAVIAGCNSRAIEQGRVEVPVRATASADPSQPMLRTIPDVITKPKPFRLPDAIGPTMSLEPATMAPRGGIALAAAERVAPAPTTLDFPTGRPAVEEVAAMLGEYLRAFNRHDPAALAAHWSEAGENVDLDTGETTRGREAVAEVFATLFQEDAGATIDIDVESIRPIRDDVALVDGVSRIGFSDGASPAAPSGSRFSAVVVKEQGRWMLASVREASLAAVIRKSERSTWLTGTRGVKATAAAA